MKTRLAKILGVGLAAFALGGLVAYSVQALTSQDRVSHASWAGDGSHKPTRP
jgi:Spy/CpxP family protein refolding chaperone